MEKLKVLLVALLVASLAGGLFGVGCVWLLRGL